MYENPTFVGQNEEISNRHEYVNLAEIEENENVE